MKNRWHVLRGLIGLTLVTLMCALGACATATPEESEEDLGEAQQALGCTPACIPFVTTCCRDVCKDLANDHNNCGQCGHVCESYEQCYGGVCHI